MEPLFFFYYIIPFFFFFESCCAGAIRSWYFYPLTLKCCHFTSVFMLFRYFNLWLWYIGNCGGWDMKWWISWHRFEYFAMEMCNGDQGRCCVLQNAIGKDNTAGVSTSHISSENSFALPTSFYASTPLILMTIALSLCLFLSSSVVL